MPQPNQTAVAATAAPKNPYTDPKAAREYLTSIGIDPSQLDDGQAKTLAFMGWYQDFQQKNFGAVTPPPATAGELTNYMTQAERELAPQERNDFAQFKSEFVNNMNRIAQDAGVQSSARELETQRQKEELAANMAESGTALGDIRKRAEERLRRTTGGIVRSEASDVAQKIRDQASQFEKTYGPAELAKLRIPELSYAGVKVPAYVGAGTTEGFGTQQIAHKVNAIGRQGEIAAASQDKKAAELKFAAGKPL